MLNVTQTKTTDVATIWTEGDDDVTRLWVRDVESGIAQCIAHIRKYDGESLEVEPIPGHAFLPERIRRRDRS